jgi:uncharacterized protein YbjT (DUF2867 family)
VTAFVLGASGFVGREVVRQLCVRGSQVIAHVRQQSFDKWRGPFTEMGATVDTTPWDTVAMTAKFREVKPAEIYVLIGTTKNAAKRDKIDGDIYEQIDLGLTRIAVEAARASEANPRIVYLSSVGASTGAGSAYLRARGKAEEVVTTSGLPWAIARPSFITGDRDESRPGERSAATITDGLLAVAGVLGGKKLRDKYRSTSPDVLASALIRIGEAPEHDRLVEGADLR